MKTAVIFNYAQWLILITCSVLSFQIIVFAIIIAIIKNGRNDDEDQDLDLDQET